MSADVTRNSFYSHCLETVKHQFVETNKATVSSLKDRISKLEDSILAGCTLTTDIADSLSLLQSRMSEKHYGKLCALFRDPTFHMDIIEMSIYTQEGEVSIPLLYTKKGEKKLFLLSEGGNVSTLTRLAYKLIRLLFDLKHRSREGVCHRVRRKRDKQE